MQKGLFVRDIIFPCTTFFYSAHIPTNWVVLVSFLMLTAFANQIHAQALPTGIVSTVLTIQLPDSSLGSPNNAATVIIKSASISNIKKAHLSVVNVSDSVLFSQVYDVKRSSVYNVTGGYTISLRFFTQIDIGNYIIKVRLEDNNGNLGAPFAIVQ